MGRNKEDILAEKARKFRCSDPSGFIRKARMCADNSIGKDFTVRLDSNTRLTGTIATAMIFDVRKLPTRVVAVFELTMRLKTGATYPRKVYVSTLPS